MSLPTIAFVAGAWHSPSCFDRVAKLVQEAGFQTRYIGPLPSVGQAIEDPNEDVQCIREALLDEVDGKKKNVVLVVHSYGGIPGSMACAGLAKSARADRETAVIGVVYLCSFAVKKGMSLADAVGGTDPPWYRRKGDVVDPATPEKIFYNDCSEEDQVAASAALRSQSLNVLSNKSTYEVWKHIPATYLICELDQAIPAFAQRMFLDWAGPGTFKYTEAIQSGHSPFYSMPKETANFILKSTREYLLP